MGGDIIDEPVATTVVYAPDVVAFVDARRWDRACLKRSPVMQAQADPVDQAALAALRRSYGETPPTEGWPGRHQRRFEDDRGV